MRRPTSAILPTACAAAMLLSASAWADGLVGCWGANDFGQCAVPPALVVAKQVAAGVNHSVALRSDGIVLAWGDNALGQRAVPSTLGACTAVAAGYYHTLAIRTDATLVCWGNNADLQCNPPANLGTVIWAAAGNGHSVAVRTNGTVAAWGDNAFGQATVSGTLGTCTRVAAGADHTLALRTAGTVAAWGYNGFGQTTVPASLGTCTAIAGGFDHSVALRSNGTVVCWGRNQFGQSAVPGSLGTCTAVAAGLDHTLALRTNGTVVAWGLNDFGQGVVPAGTPPVNRIAAGGYHNVVVGSMPVIQFVSMTPTTCGLANGAVDLTITNGVTIAWTGPNNFTASTPDLSNVGAGTYIVTVTGVAGTAPASAQVVVTATADTTAPTVTSYTNALSAAANASCQAPVADFTATVVASDNCAVTSITQSPVAGALVGLGNTAVTITVRDAANNTVTRNATFTVTGTSATWYRDADGDNFGTPATTATGCAAPAGFVSNNLDCNDSNAAINPNTIWYRDLDGDGAGAAGDGTLTQCAQPTGYVLSNTDECSTDPTKTAPGVCGCGVPDTDTDADGIADCLDNCASIANPDQRDCDANGVGDACQIARGVPPDCNGNGAYDVPAEMPTIQAAINAVGPGTPRVVQVAAGIYAGPVSLGGKDIVLRGAGAANTVLDGTAALTASVLVFAGGEPATTAIEGFTIRGGTTGTTVGTAPIDFRGGAVFARNAAGAIRDCVIESSTSMRGGGLALLDASLLLERCTIRSSSATFDGGGIHIERSHLTLAQCEVTGNTAPSAGGILLEATQPAGSLLLVGTRVCGNTLWNIVGEFTTQGDATEVCDCFGDVNADGVVNAIDVASLLSVWGTDGGIYPRADGNLDGTVSAQDITILLSAWGACRQ